MHLGQFVEGKAEIAVVVDTNANRTRVRLVLSDGRITDWQAATEWKAIRLPMLPSAWTVPFMRALYEGRDSISTDG